ncbi:unnamed protein product, partial [Rotaria sp. Silwood2]
FSFAKNGARSILKAARDGILEEGRKIDQISQAILLAQQLENMMLHASDNDPFPLDNGQQCFNLYSQETFLYKLINKALREQDQTKISTLGPFCFLLNSYLFEHVERSRHNVFRGSVYRGTNLSSEMIDLYRKDKGSYRKWLSFTSTSRNRVLAEIFGNALFIIDIRQNYYKKYCAEIDVAEASHFPIEEEVLLPAGVSFKIEDVKYCEDTKKHIISLTTGTPN